jgi:hypothetical protein
MHASPIRYQRQLKVPLDKTIARPVILFPRESPLGDLRRVDFLVLARCHTPCRDGTPSSLFGIEEGLES